MSTNTSSRQEQHLTPADRGGCLTSWLVLMIIAALFTLYSLYANSSHYFGTYGVHAGPVLWYFLVYILLETTILGGVIALFLWRRWGFYLIASCYAMSIFLDILRGVPYTSIILYLVGRSIGLALLFWLLRQDGRWARFFH
jgi:hypothetical protein